MMTNYNRLNPFRNKLASIITNLIKLVGCISQMVFNRERVATAGIRVAPAVSNNGANRVPPIANVHILNPNRHFGMLLVCVYLVIY